MVYFLVFFAISYANGMLLLRRLRSMHNFTWTQLGSPTLTQSNFSRPFWKLMKYVWGFQFLKQHDNPLTIMCLAAMLLEIVLMVIFVWLIWSPATA